MKERKLKTPVLDAYMADLNRSARNVRRWALILLAASALATVLLVRYFNPVMDAIDRVVMNEEATTQETQVWQQIINATAGSMFLLDDQSHCVLDAPYLQTRILKMRCKDTSGIESQFTEQLVSEIIDYYPVGSEKWRRHKYIFFEDVLS